MFLCCVLFWFVLYVFFLCIVSMLPVSQCYLYLNVTCISMLPVSQCYLYLNVTCISMFPVSQCYLYLNVTCISMLPVSQCYCISMLMLPVSQCYCISMLPVSQCYLYLCLRTVILNCLFGFIKRLFIKQSLELRKWVSYWTKDYALLWS